MRPRAQAFITHNIYLIRDEVRPQQRSPSQLNSSRHVPETQLDSTHPKYREDVQVEAMRRGRHGGAGPCSAAVDTLNILQAYPELMPEITEIMLLL